VLGAILLDNTALKTSTEYLHPACFFVSQNVVIFRMMIAIAAAKRPIDLVTLTEDLQSTGNLEAAGGAAYLASLADGMPKVSNVGHYAKIVHDKYLLRSVVHKTYQMQQRALEGNTNYEDLCTDFSLFAKQTAPGAGAQLVSVDCQDLLLMDVEPVNFVIEPILPVKGIGMIYAWRGVGKTFFTMEMAYDVSIGAPCFVWNIPQKRRVTYVDGEMDVETLQQRLQEIARGHKMQMPEKSFLQFITPDLQKKYMPKINSKPSQVAIEDHLQHGDLLILDNLSALCPSSNEDETGDWIMVQEWLLHLRRSGITVLFMHHAGKGGSQRGFSGKEDLINVTINLRRGDGYQMEEQLRAEVHLEKVRGKSAVGTWVQPFEITLTTEDGAAQWLQRPLRDIIEKRAFQMFAAGMKPNDVAQDLRLNRYQVYRLRKKFEGGYKPEDE
jgi:AAA domain/DnaB-like helicase N terminal domain